MKQDQRTPQDTVRGNHALNPHPRPAFSSQQKPHSEVNAAFSALTLHFYGVFEGMEKFKMLFEQTALPFLFTETR